MKPFKKLLFLLIILNFTLANAKPVPESFADLAEKLMPSVVNISTTQTVRTTTNQFFSFQAHHLEKCLKTLKDQQKEKLHHLIWLRN